MKKYIFFFALLFPLFRLFVKFNIFNKDFYTHKSLPFWDSINGGVADYMYFWGTGKFIQTYGVHKLIDVQFYLSFLQNNITHANKMGLWAYPPTFNFFITILSFVPLLYSFCIFTLATILFSFFVYRKLFPYYFSLILTFSPMAFLCYDYGQLGVLITSLILLSLFYTSPSKINFSLDKNMLSGIIFGLCSVKYPFIILIPFYLFFTKSWKTFFYMILTIVILIISSIFVYGIQSWLDYFEVLAPLMKNSMENLKENIFVSPLPSLMTMGVPKSIAWGMQFLISFGTVASLYYVIKKNIFSKKEELYSFILGLILIATPYSHTYDLPMIAPIMLILMKKFYLIKNPLVFLIFGIWFLIGIGDLLFNCKILLYQMPLINCSFIIMNLFLFWFYRDKKEIL